MQSLADIARRMQADLDIAIKSNRAKRLAHHDLPTNVGCSACGDTGTDLTTGEYCRSCGRGLALYERSVRANQWAWMVPRLYRSYSIATHPDPEAVRRAEAWYSGLTVDEHGDLHGGVLVLSGGVGSGKTGLAIALVRRAWIDHAAMPPQPIGGSWPDMLDRMRWSETQKVPVMPATYAAAGLLMLDDIGTERVTEKAAEQLYVIADGRYRHERPTVVCTNLALDALADQIGERIASRLLSDAEVVPMAGPDRRRV